MHRRDFLVAALTTAAAGPALAQAGPAPASPTSPPTPLPDVIAGYAAENSFSGSVLVQQGGQQLYHRAFGLADRALAVPASTGTRYRIASITKLFTAVLVMRQVEAGKVTLDTTIKTALPAWTGEGAGKVTIRHLLTHTSGIQNMDNLPSFEAAQKEGIPSYQLPHTSDELLARYASGKQVAEPGKVFDYNNADYVILGKIIERAAGAPYDQVLAREITGPLGMARTGLQRQQDITPGLASTYYRDGDKPLINDLPVYIENWYAAGGMSSTTTDLLAFSNALHGGRLLRPDSLKALLTPGLDDYGFGQWVFDLKVKGAPHRVAQRPGRIMGANATLLRFLDDDLTVIILSNTNQTDIDAFSFKIGRAALA